MKRGYLIILISAIAAQLAAQDPRPGAPGRPGAPPPRDPFAELLFPPELVMQHQSEIGLQDSQRSALQTAMQQAQAKFMDVQWKLSGEGEKLQRLLQNAVIDETQVLAQVDQVLALEREMKRAQMGLMVRIKNTLTPAQQSRLRELRRPRDE